MPGLSSSNLAFAWSSPSANALPVILPSLPSCCHNLMSSCTSTGFLALASMAVSPSANNFDASTPAALSLSKSAASASSAFSASWNCCVRPLSELPRSIPSDFADAAARSMIRALTYSAEAPAFSRPPMKEFLNSVSCTAFNLATASGNSLAIEAAVSLLLAATVPMARPSSVTELAAAGS